MRKISKQEILLNQLKQYPEGLSLPELIQLLGSSYSERSVRRWLANYAVEGIVTKKGQKRSTRYYILQPSEDSAAQIAGLVTVGELNAWLIHTANSQGRSA